MTKHYNTTQQKETRRKLRKSQTLAERNMWSHFRNRQLLRLKIKRQFSIDNLIIDLYCPQYKIAIELDGNIHASNDKKRHDEKRQKYLESYGINFIRIINNEYLSNADIIDDRLEEKKLLISDRQR
jgi:very-short-patch-repair endonuclease